MFTSRLTKSLSKEVADLLSIILASELSFLLVYLFTRWEKLFLIDVGVVPSKASIQRFIIGYVIGLVMAATQVLIVFGFGHLQLLFISHITAREIIVPF